MLLDVAPLRVSEVLPRRDMCVQMLCMAPIFGIDLSYLDNSWIISQSSQTLSLYKRSTCAASALLVRIHLGMGASFHCATLFLLRLFLQDL